MKGVDMRTLILALVAAVLLLCLPIHSYAGDCYVPSYSRYSYYPRYYTNYYGGYSYYPYYGYSYYYPYTYSYPLPAAVPIVQTATQELQSGKLSTEDMIKLKLLLKQLNLELQQAPSPQSAPNK
jgi:hypothetical protein